MLLQGKGECANHKVQQWIHFYAPHVLVIYKVISLLYDGNG